MRGKSSQLLSPQPCFKVCDNFGTALSAGICKSVIVPDISVEGIRAMRYEVLDSVKVALGGSDAKGGAAVVIESIDLPPQDVKGLHEKDIAVIGSVVEAELVVRHSDLREL